MATAVTGVHCNMAHCTCMNVTNVTDHFQKLHILTCTSVIQGGIDNSRIQSNMVHCIISLISVEDLSFRSVGV